MEMTGTADVRYEYTAVVKSTKLLTTLLPLLAGSELLQYSNIYLFD